MTLLTRLADHIWIVDGDEVSWYSMPYTTRTTVIKLADGSLWIHSPGNLGDELRARLRELGEVGYLVSPNKIHHLFLADWKAAYPQARLYASPGLRAKRSDIHFDADLKDEPEPAWRHDIDQLIFRGSPAMQEVVFFHRASKTLILTDLIENFPAGHFRGYKKVLAKITGIVAPNGKTPLDWRMSFYFGRREARACLNRVRAWPTERIVLAHGDCVFSDAGQFLDRSFRWLDPARKR